MNQRYIHIPEHAELLETEELINWLLRQEKRTYQDLQRERTTSHDEAHNKGRLYQLTYLKRFLKRKGVEIEEDSI